MNSSAVLSISLDTTSTVPLYRQLQANIEELISQQRLVEGEKMPSSRELAEMLSISRTSALNALNNLVAEGVLVALPKKGLFVAENNPSQFSLAEQTDDMNVVYSAIKTPLKTFSSGADTSVFPTKAWAKSMKNGWRCADEMLLQGEYENGLPALKVQICRYLKQLRGLHCVPEQISVTAGNRDSLSIILHALGTHGLDTQKIGQESLQKIWLEEACYPPVHALFTLLNKDIYPLAIDQEGTVVPSDNKGMALLTPCRQYPLGLAMSSRRRQQWLAFLAQQKQRNQPFWVIEDDYDNEFVYQGRVSVPLMQQDRSHSVFFVGSFSKVLFRGLRLSFIVSPLHMVEVVKASQSALGVANNSAMQPALVDFMTSGRFISHIKKMRRLYLTKRNFMLDELCQLQGCIEWETINGGMHVCVYLKPEFVHLESQIIEAARLNKLKLTGLSEHFFICKDAQASYGKSGFILGFTQQSIEQLREYLDLFKDCVLQVIRER